MPSESDRRSNLAGVMESMKVNCADLTPLVANLLSPADVPSLKVLILGGESISIALIRKWTGHVKLINTYGPTECAIVSTVAVEATRNSDPANIGFPTLGRAWVVNPWNHHQLSPPGAVDELLMEGPFLARGYLYNQTKTDEVFVTGVAWASLDRRLYKTGDLVRRTDDGSFTFVRRKDTQVKIRGQRVELEEVEKHLFLVSEVSDVAVETLLFEGGQQVLATFLVPRDQQTPGDLLLPMTSTINAKFQAIEQDLRGVLPDYMVPSLFIPLRTLPITTSGKLNRTQL